MKKIFVIDDNNLNLLNAAETLSEHYDVYTQGSAAIMFDFLNNVTPDLILLDIVMPDIGGFEAIKRLKSDPRHSHIPVIFLTGKSDAHTEALGFELGGVDFISKPFSGPVLLNRIKAHLHMEEIVRERTAELEQRTAKLVRLQNSIVSVLANMVESRDTLTGRHIERTTGYVAILLSTMLEQGIYAELIKDWNLDVVISSARLHDIGKIVVSDTILNKPGKLTDEEFEAMKSHPGEGEKMIDGIITEAGDDAFLQYAKQFAGYHHEKWNGTGYPHRLEGHDIPLLGRIMAIADVYDALVSERPYKKAFTHEKAVEIILEGRGAHFDPQIVDAFLKVEGAFASLELRT
ncbi:MAG: response regulator [Holophagaceae bacterium]|nr:response regulator [Holophagaceae bacterium]